MGQFPRVWQYPEALASAFALSARDSALEATRSVNGTVHECLVADAKVLLEQAAAVVAGPLHPYFTLQDVEDARRTPSMLPPAALLEDEELDILAGSDPLCCAYSRSALAHAAALRAEEAAAARDREEAFVEYREDELRPREMIGVKMIAEAQTDLVRVLDTSTAADVIDLTARFQSDPQQRKLLRLIA